MSEVAAYYDQPVESAGITGAGLVWLMGRDHLSPSYSNQDEIALDASQWRSGAQERCLSLVDSMGVVAGDLVLDIGTGIGGPGRDIIQHTGCRLIGINISFKQLQSLRKLSVIDSESFMDVAQADGQQLPLASNKFDHVYSINMLYHIPDPALVISEIGRLLKSGGTFGLDDWFLTDIATSDTKEKLRYEWSSPEGFHQYSSITDLLSSYGLATLREIDYTQEAAAFLTKERFGKTFDEQIRPKIVELFPQLYKYPEYEESHAVTAAQQLSDAIMYMGELYRSGEAVYKQIIVQKR